jgi:hypothetical protein
MLSVYNMPLSTAGIVVVVIGLAFVLAIALKLLRKTRKPHPVPSTLTDTTEASDGVPPSIP